MFLFYVVNIRYFITVFLLLLNKPYIVHTLYKNILTLFTSSCIQYLLTSIYDIVTLHYTNCESKFFSQNLYHNFIQPIITLHKVFQNQPSLLLIRQKVCFGLVFYSHKWLLFIEEDNVVFSLLIHVISRKRCLYGNHE